jgi:uncharacterized protein (DUF1697 family)
MADLRKLLEQLKFRNAATYIQSGNVVFQSEESDSKKLEAQLEKGLEQKFGFEVPVIVIEFNQYKKTAESNPYLKENPAIEKLYITHFKGTPTKEGIQKLSEFNIGKDQYELENHTVYLLYDEKVSVSKLSNNLLENKLKVVATTRNWKTTLKLIEMAGSSSR